MVLVVRSNGSLVLSVRITLYPGRDDDLIELVQNAPKGSLAGVIREAMRNGTQKVEFVPIQENEGLSSEIDSLGFEL
jgi:hypothetical protein